MIPFNGRLAARVARLEEEAGHQRDEIAELRSRLFWIEERMGRVDGDTVLRRRLVERVSHAVVETPELELDETKTSRLASRRIVLMAERLRAQAARFGLSHEDLDAEMGWPEGRTESVLSIPEKADHEDVVRLSERLGVPMTRVFELETPDESEGAG